MHDIEALLAEVDRLRAKETESEWEWAEFDADELQPDGTLHPWAEPKDVWDHPLPADEVAELRGDGSVYAKRRKSAWQIIGAGEQDA